MEKIFAGCFRAVALPLTYGAMRSSGLELLNFQFKTNDK